ITPTPVPKETIAEMSVSPVLVPSFRWTVAAAGSTVGRMNGVPQTVSLERLQFTITLAVVEVEVAFCTQVTHSFPVESLATVRSSALAEVISTGKQGSGA